MTRYRETARTDRWSCRVALPRRAGRGPVRTDRTGQDRGRGVPRRAAARRDRLGRLHAGLRRPAASSPTSRRAQQLAAVRAPSRGRRTTRTSSSPRPRTRSCAHARSTTSAAAGRRPILEGGSGLYLRAALGGLAFGPPPGPARPARRTRGAAPRDASAGSSGTRWTLDPRDRCASSTSRNPRRLVRALRDSAHHRGGRSPPPARLASGRPASALPARAVRSRARADEDAARRSRRARRRDARARASSTRCATVGAVRRALAHRVLRPSACARSAPSSTESRPSTEAAAAMKTRTRRYVQPPAHLDEKAP